ncbi:MAG: hypothetical protein JO099_07510, partial [Acidobacteriia bacterium]|nr:hypothetical protein [Terriglobia bacterium]
MAVGLLFCQCSQSGQVTRIAVNATALQSGVKRLGINLGGVNYYDSGQMMKNLIFRNPGFEGEIYQSTIQCAAGTPTTCLDATGYSAWPAGFWNGASFQFFYGAAKGRGGTITNYTAAANGIGGTFTLSNSGVSPAAGDYLIVRKSVPGNAAAGWWVSQSGAGSVGTNTTDLPPATTGKQTVSLSAPGASDAAGIAAYFDSTTSNGISFNNLNGTFQLSFQAKGTGGSNSIGVSAARYGGGQTFLNQTVALTASWANYTLSFTAAETGTAPGAAGVKFFTVGADSLYLDNVSLVQTNSNPNNPTAFRD